MSSVWQDQREIWQLLTENQPSSCFLRLHKDEQKLFITDFPARNPDETEKMREQLLQKGLTADWDGRGKNMWSLDFTKEKWLEKLRQAEKKEKKENKESKNQEENSEFDFLITLFSKNKGENTDTARFIYRETVKRKAASLPSEKDKSKKTEKNKSEKEKFYRALCGKYALLLRKKGILPGKGCAALLKQYVRSFS